MCLTENRSRNKMQFANEVVERYGFVFTNENMAIPSISVNQRNYVI